MIDFRRCDECGGHFPRAMDHCPSCGRCGLDPGDLVKGSKLAVTGGLPSLAIALAFFVPSPWEPVLVASGFAPIFIALAWLVWRHRRADPTSFAHRIADVERRLDEVEQDLAQTEERSRAAREDLESERNPRAVTMLERELAQDQRLRTAQRKLVCQLERRLEQLEIERFRAELRYFEACRDACVDEPHLSYELGQRIRQVEHQLGGIATPAWATALEEARLLRRQLSRGVQRLRAAVRLDPLAHADLTGELPDESPEVAEGELDDRVQAHLERIDRSFAALEELASEIVGDPDASGVRVRVDDEVMAALEEAELEVERERISFEGL